MPAPALAAALMGLLRTGAGTVAARMAGTRAAGAAAGRSAGASKGFAELLKNFSEGGLPMGKLPSFPTAMPAPKSSADHSAAYLGAGSGAEEQPVMAEEVKPVSVADQMKPPGMSAPMAMATGLGGGLLALKASAAIVRWTEGLVESQRHLARFSPILAKTVAQMDRQQILLDRDSARRTAGSTGFAASGLMGLKDEIQPLIDTATSVKNLVGGSLIRGVTALTWAVKHHPAVMILQKGVDILEQWIGSEDKNTPTPMRDVMDQVTKDRWGQPKNKRPGEP